MGIHAIGAIRRAKLMIGGRILALAVQFTLAQDATAQLATDQLVPQMDRQYESAPVRLAPVPRRLPKIPATDRAL
jgi:hypothetical protein